MSSARTARWISSRLLGGFFASMAVLLVAEGFRSWGVMDMPQTVAIASYAANSFLSGFLTAVGIERIANVRSK